MPWVSGPIQQLMLFIYAELGRTSLQCDRHTNILKFYNRISSLNSERYVNNAFYMLANDAESGHSNWVFHVRELQIRYKIQQTDN